MEHFIADRRFVTGAQLSQSPGRVQFVEYVYYAALFYGYMGEALGFSINMLGAGMIAAVAILCFLRPGAHLIFNLPLSFPILFAVSFFIVQIAVHGESVMHEYARPVIIWILTVIIISALCSRPGFIPRFAAALFCMGLTMLPFIDLDQWGRADVNANVGVLSNPNGMGMFFGFIAVAFTVRGLESRRGLARWLHMAIALFSVLMVGITVSRSQLIAYSVALIIALRKKLRRSFIPVLILVALGGGAFALGLFDGVIASYIERGMEDTGRPALWSGAFTGFIESPIAGVGVSKTYIPFPNRPYPVTPHNAFLFVGFSSGIIPLILFAGYWFMGLLGALKASPRNSVYPYLLPLWVYAFFSDQFASQAFVEPWSAFCVCICLVQLIPKHSGRRLQHKPIVSVNSHPRRVPLVARPLSTRK